MTQTSTAAATVPAGAGSAVRTPWSEFWRKFKKQKLGMIALGFVILLILIAIFGPWIVPFDPEDYFDYDMINSGPTAAHWFGVDPLGRDIFSRVLAGTRISLVTGFFSVFVGGLINKNNGLMDGYCDGW